MSSLEKYQRKRNFQRTPEPSGEHPEQPVLLPPTAARFVIHKHDAQTLHYDLRLEQNGVFKSWAIPKGPSLEPGEKRLAVRVEDHPLAYGDFEGVIPSGEYGGGTVMLWDRGRWAAIGTGKKQHKQSAGDHLDFVLAGQKLAGAWTLVRMAGRSRVKADNASVHGGSAGDTGARGKNPDNWLLIKRHDNIAAGNASAERQPSTESQPGTESQPSTASQPSADGQSPNIEGESPSAARFSATDRSVATGRTMKQIAADSLRTWTHSGEANTGEANTGEANTSEANTSEANTSEAKTDNANTGTARTRTQTPTLPEPTTLPGARRQPLPAKLQPALATLVEKAPAGESWLHEIKFDGYRILAYRDGGRVRLISRNGKDWTRRFPEIAALLGNLRVEAALLDGEIVALTSGGTSSFRALQEALSTGNTQALVYHAFDLLHLNGYDLRDVPLLDRKRALEALLAASGFTGSATLRYTTHLLGQGPEVVEQACRLGLEGIVSKRAHGRYPSGRSRNWRKVKCTAREELLVCGYTEPGGSRTGFGALLLGAWQGNTLVYTGKVGTGFSERALAALHARLRALESRQSPFANPPSERGIHWVRPELVAEVEFTEWTRDGALRHPVFLGLREDRDPMEITAPSGQSHPLPIEPQSKPDDTAPAGQPLSASGEAHGSGPAPRPGTAQGKSTVAGITLTNPDRILYPELGITKLALAQYYEDIEPWLLPQLAHRPLALVRCPEGHTRECFFQKHPRRTLAKSVPRLPIEEKDGPALYLYINAIADVVALVQSGVLEFHVWGCRVDDVEHPDILVFDLDPAPDVPFPELLRVARELRDRLAALGLATFPRTTGGKGLHLVAPIVPGRDWNQAKAFSQAVAQAHARDDRRRVTANMAKAKRQGRIYIDYLRNGRGATAIASYSTRAKPGAPVAVPVAWDELNEALRPDRYTVENLRRRLAVLKPDPWEGFEAARQPLTAAMFAAVGLE